MNQKGSASLELALGMAVLVIPALVAVVSFGPWLEAKAFVRAAAAEAARAAVISLDDPVAAGAAVVMDMANGRGVEAPRVGMCGASPVVGGSGLCVLGRGEVVTATVAVDVALISTPWGEVGDVTVAATHTEPVDAYRSLP